MGVVQRLWGVGVALLGFALIGGLLVFGGIFPSGDRSVSEPADVVPPETTSLAWGASPCSELPALATERVTAVASPAGFASGRPKPRNLVRVTSSLGLPLEKLEARGPDEDAWQPLTAADEDSATTYELKTGDLIVARGHRPARVALGAERCALEPDSSLTLDLPLGPDSIRAWDIGDVIAGDTLLGAGLREAFVAARTETGLAVAVDVAALRQSLGQEGELPITVYLNSGHVIDVEWVPSSGAQIVESIAPADVPARTELPLEVLLTWDESRLPFDEDCEVALRYLDRSPAVLHQREWGEYRVQQKGGGKRTVQGRGRVRFESVLLGGRYCVTTFSPTSGRYGRTLFEHSGSVVETTLLAPNRLRGRLVVDEGACPVPSSLGVVVRYEGDHSVRAWDWSGTVALDAAGRFDAVVVPPPKASAKVAFPVPRVAHVTLSTPGFQAWSTDASWNAEEADLGRIRLLPGPPELELAPLAVNLDVPCYSVFSALRSREWLVERSAKCGNRRYLEVDGSLPASGLGNALLVAHDPYLKAVSGFVRENGVWEEVPGVLHEFRVEQGAKLLGDEVLVIGLAWRGIRAGFGSFDAYDFAFEGGIPFTVIGPEQGFEVWSYRKQGTGRSAEIVERLGTGLAEFEF